MSDPSSEPRRTEVAGLTCAEWGPPSAGRTVDGRPSGRTTVLALHGLTSTSEVWRAFAEALPATRVVAPDLPGRAGSVDVKAGPGLAGHATAVLALAEQLGLDDVTIVGHSMGAFLAPLVAAGLGTRVRRVVLLDGGIAPETNALLRREVVKATFGMRVQTIGQRWPSLDAFVDGLDGAAIDNRPDLRPRLLEWAGYLLEGPEGDLRARIDPHRLVDDAADTLAGIATLPALTGLDFPVHAVVASHGADDTKGPFISDKALAEGHIVLPRMTTARIGANHLTMLFDPTIAGLVV